MTTVFIRGLGLIGSSLARIIKHGHPETQIIASDCDEEALVFAKEHQLIDESAPDLAAATQADFIILATPVSQIVADLQDLASRKLKKGVIVTDAGSSKQTVMAAAQDLLAAGVNFIGGHPMAGSHLVGVRAGRADLFAGAYYFLVPTQQTAGLADLEDLLSAARVKWTPITAPEHDKLVAQISHVPHIVADALVNQSVTTLDGQQPGIKAAAGGFKSTTRIAKADPAMWTAVVANNRDNISHQLGEYITELEGVKELIDRGDQAALRQFFVRAQRARQKLD